MRTAASRLLRSAMQRCFINNTLNSGSSTGRSAAAAAARRTPLHNSSLGKSRRHFSVDASRGPAASQIIFQRVHGALTTRQCHCLAQADSSSPAAAAEEQHPGSNADDGTPAAAALQDAPAEAAAVAQTDGAGWAGFLQALWQRGYFEEHSSGQDMSAATSSRRDIKKAIQHFARKRPDIVLQLPFQLLADLSNAEFPDLLEKKARTALLRLKAGAGSVAGQQATSGPLTGRASTQDVLRVMWALVDTSTADADDAAAATTSTTSSSSSLSGANAEVLQRCATAVLNLEAQPPNEALVKAAEAAAATPTAASYEQHQSRRADYAAAAATGGNRRERGSTGREGRVDRRAGRDDKRPSSAQGAGSDGGSRREQEAAPRFPRSEDPVVQHKLRLLKSAPYTALRAGDWFCGECGAHNYAFKQLCFRCEVPSNSLGVSKVTPIDVRQLQQIGLGQGVAFEQRGPAVAFTLQVAEAVLETAALSIPAAAKAAGMTKFRPVELPQQEAAAGSSGSSSSSSRRRDDSGSSSRGERSSFRDSRDSRGSRDSRDSRGSRDKDGFEDRPWERRGPVGGSRREGGSAAEGRGELGEEPRASRSALAADGGSSGGAAAASSGSSVDLTDAFKEAFGDMQQELGLPSTTAAAAPAAAPGSRVRRLWQRDAAAAAAGGASRSSDDDSDTESDGEGSLQQERRGPRRDLFRTGADSSRGASGGRREWGSRGRGSSSTWGDADSASSPEGEDLSGWADEYADVVGDTQQGRSVRRSIQKDLDAIFDDRGSSRGRWEDRGGPRGGGRGNPRGGGWYGRRGAAGGWDGDRHERGEGRGSGRGGYERRGAAGDWDRQERGEGRDSGRGEEGGGGEGDGWYQRKWEQRDRDAGRGGGRGRRGGRGGGRSDRRERDSKATDKPSWVSGVWE